MKAQTVGTVLKCRGYPTQPQSDVVAMETANAQPLKRDAQRNGNKAHRDCMPGLFAQEHRTSPQKCVHKSSFYLKYVSDLYLFSPFQLHSVVCVTFKIQSEYALTCLAYICLIPFTSRHVQVLENNLDAEKRLLSYGGFTGSKTCLLDRDRPRKCKTFLNVKTTLNFIQYLMGPF